MRRAPRIPVLSAVVMAALSVSAAMAQPARPPAAYLPGPRTNSMAVRDSAVSDRDAHRHRDRTVIVDEGPFYQDPFWAWDWEAPWYPAPYAAGYAYFRAAHRGLVPIELHVHPWKASVIVDRSALGQARDYNDDTHPLWLNPGRHVVELQYPGYRVLRFQLDLQKGLPRNLHYRLSKGKGVDPRSHTAEAPANGIAQPAS